MLSAHLLNGSYPDLTPEDETPAWVLQGEQERLLMFAGMGLVRPREWRILDGLAEDERRKREQAA